MTTRFAFVRSGVSRAHLRELRPQAPDLRAWCESECE